MAKQDLPTQLDVTRNGQKEVADNKPTSNPEADSVQKTEVKNSNASGLGAMGRSDEQIEKNDEGRAY